MDEIGLTLHNDIYLDIEAIFDVRYGLLLKYHKNALRSSILNDNYTTRIYEEVDYVTNQHMKFLNTIKDKNILKRSYFTKALTLAFMEYTMMNEKLVHSGENGIISFTINTYPYELSDSEKNYIKRAMSLYSLSGNINVDFIFKPYTEITFNYIGSGFNVAIMYNVLDWLDYHATMKTGIAVNTKLYGPTLLHQPVVFNNVKDIEKTFDSLSELYKPFIDLTFINMEFFCFTEASKDKIKEELNIVDD